MGRSDENGQRRNRVKNHLELRGTKWYLRWDVPADAQPAFDNKRVIKIPLSKDKREAQRLRDLLIGGLKTKVLEYRNRNATAKNQEDAEQQLTVERLANLHSRFVLNTEDETIVRIVKDSIDLEEMCASIEGQNELIEECDRYIEDILRDAPNEVKPFLNEKGKNYLFATQEGAAKQFKSIDSRQKYHTTQSEFQMEIQMYAAWNGGAFSTPYTEFRNRTINSKITYEKTLKHGVSQHLINNWHKYLDSGNTKTKTKDGIKRGAKEFLKFLEKNNLEITYQTVSDYLIQYSNSISTRQTQLGAIKTLYEWLVKYSQEFFTKSQTMSNPVMGHNLKQEGGIKKESYIGFTTEEVKHLFSSSFDFSKNGQLLATLIAYGAYTGCRIEELSQIDINSTIFEGDIPIGFKLTASKTKSGIRSVPLHPHLAPLHLHLLKERNGGPIFPHRKISNGSRISYLSKAFGRLKTHYGFGAQHAFHSLRSTFINEVTRLGVALIKIEKIVGHKPLGTTMGVYLDELPLDLLSEAIADLDFMLDLTKLKSQPH